MKKLKRRLTGQKLINRGGTKIRHTHTFYRGSSVTTYDCFNCGSHSLKRKAGGIWQCKKCGFCYAGNTYKP